MLTTKTELQIVGHWNPGHKRLNTDQLRAGMERAADKKLMRPVQGGLGPWALYLYGGGERSEPQEGTPALGHVAITGVREVAFPVGGPGRGVMRIGTVGQLYVDPELRGQGAAASLLNAMHKWAFDGPGGFDGLVANCNPTSAPVFAEKAGYAELAPDLVTAFIAPSHLPDMTSYVHLQSPDAQRWATIGIV